MKWMHAAVVGCLVAGLVGCGDGKSTKETSKSDTSTVHKETLPPDRTNAGKGGDNKDKIVGSWELVKSEAEDAPKGAIMEFTKDGKMKVSFKEGDKQMDAQGTYTVEGDKLKGNIAPPGGGKPKENVGTITRLTDSELHIKDEHGKTDEYRKK